MTRHIVWQALLAVVGAVLVFVILFQLVTTTPPEPETAEVPVAGGTYVEGVLGYSERINPVLAPVMVPANPVDQDLSALVFDGLTTLNESGQVSPALALEWEASEDGTVYEFRLREDVRWHDGAPFTAADVAFTVQAMQDPSFQGDPNLGELWRNVSVEQLDSHTVRFTLQEAFPSFLQYTSIGLLPAHLLGNVPASDLPRHDFSTKSPVGTGMFTVESISPDRVVLGANRDYWRAQPFLDRIEFWFYADWDGLLEDYGRGDLLGFHPPRLRYLPDLAGMPALNLYSAQSTGFGLVYLNLLQESLPFFQEQEVRQALLYALDRQVLVDQVMGGQGLVADSPILPTTWAYNSGLRQYNHDPERAIGLLDASGWMDSDGNFVRDKDGVELAFTLLTSDDETMIRMAEEIARQWRAVGVDTTVRSVDSDAAIDFVRARNFDAVLIEVELTADPDPYPLWHSTQVELGQNFAGFASDEADQVMEEARFSTDLEERMELYHLFQQIFAEEIPALPIYYPMYAYAVDSQVRDVQLSPLLHTSDRFRNVHAWYFKTEQVVVTETAEL
ncbi:MAG: ABC transporter substrate-binding protein, partial [Anaerolineae bacterium]